MRKLQIGIIGSAGPEEYPISSRPQSKIYQMSKRLGELVAESGAILVTGGKGGTMKKAAIGAKEKGGITVGIVKGNKRKVSNKFIDVEIITNAGDGVGENILVLSCDGIIAIGGGAGTLEELTIAYRNSKPVVAITGVEGYSSKVAGSYLDERKTVKIGKATSPEEAINLLLKKIK